MRSIDYEKYLVMMIIVIIVLLFNGCAVNSSVEVENLDIYEAHTPYKWKISSPEEQHLNSALIQKAVEEVNKRSYYKSFLLVRNGFLIAEKYSKARDKYDMNPVFSVTKSLMSSLTGIAIEQGYIESMDSKVLDFFPEYTDQHTDPRKYEITVGHLLTMTSGFDHETNIGAALNRSPNMIASIIASDLRFDPGSDFLYSTHSTHLLSGIIRKVTGMTTLEYLYDEVLEPAGIRSIMWSKDQNGIYFGGAGMFLTPRDMARFGYIYLMGGKLEGKQIIPSDWIQQSVINHRYYTDDWKEMEKVGYGYLWWTGEMRGYPLYFASGYGGQWILIIPELNMIIVSTMISVTENKWQQMESLITIVNDYIIPSVIDS